MSKIKATFDIDDFQVYTQKEYDELAAKLAAAQAENADHLNTIALLGEQVGDLQARIRQLEAAQGKRWEPVESGEVAVAKYDTYGPRGELIIRDGTRFTCCDNTFVVTGKYRLCRLVEATPTTDANAPG